MAGRGWPWLSPPSPQFERPVVVVVVVAPPRRDDEAHNNGALLSGSGRDACDACDSQACLWEGKGSSPSALPRFAALCSPSTRGSAPRTKYHAAYLNSGCIFRARRDKSAHRPLFHYFRCHFLLFAGQCQF